MKNTTKMFIILILAFIVVLFSVINAQPIDVNFLVTKVSLPLAVSWSFNCLYCYG
jgi:uncharacterized integral membrane protein